MKKYIYAFLMMAGLLTSCTNDDIQVDVVEVNKTTFTMNVETQSAYDTFDATAAIKDKFLSGQLGDYFIGVYTYLYDEYGNLADSQVSYSKTFGTQKQNFTLNDGKYTAVTIQMIVDKDNKYQSDTYEIVDTDKLSTVQVSYKPILDDNGNQVVDENGNKMYYSGALWYESVAAITNDLNINGSVQEINITPKAIGVVVSSYCFNYADSDYDLFAILTKNSPKGRYLDPNKTGDSRYEYTYYNKDHWWTPRGLISIKEDSGIDIYMLEEGDMQCGYAPIKDSSNFKIYGEKNGMKDGHTYHGGLFFKGNTQPDSEGAIFDSFEELVSWYNKVKDSYVPFDSFQYFTPNTTWGAKVSAVTSAMKGYNQTVGTSTTAVFDEDSGDYIILYRGVESAEAVQYYFNYSTTGLFSSTVFYDDEKCSMEDIKNVLDSEYMYLGDSDNGMAMYVSYDMKDGIMFYNNRHGYYVVDHINVSSNGAPQQAKGAKPQDVVRSMKSAEMKQLEDNKEKCMMLETPRKAVLNFSKSLFVK